MKNRIGILLILVAVCTVPAFGQLQLEGEEEGPQRQMCIDCDPAGGGGAWAGDSRYDNGQYLDNPCTAVIDRVWVNYAAYVKAAQAAAGVDQYRFNENTNVGGMYAASGSAQADVAYAQPLSIRNYYKVNTTDNFHVVTVVNFDPSQHYTWVTVETACGNGLPDSKE